MTGKSAFHIAGGRDYETSDGGGSGLDSKPPAECLICEVRACGMCAALSDENLNELRKITRSREYKAGEQIFGDEEELLNYATIKDGIVELSKILPDGRQQTIGLGFPPDFIGRAYKDKNSYYATALTDVNVCTFPRGLFDAYLKKTPELEHRLFELTLNELDTAREWMLMLGRMTALEKVAMMLLKFSDRIQEVRLLEGKMDEPVEFELPLTRAEIADFLGLTIETVSRQFSVLKQKGLIRVRAQRFVELLKKQELEELAGRS